MPANLENSAVATGLENPVFIPIPKKGNAKECSNYCTIAFISHASKGMLKILQARLQKYVNCELPDVQAGFRKGREYTEELYKKDLHDQDNHDGVITHLEPDILECEVKWALGSITMNKPSGGDGIPVELFRILKDDAVKVLDLICQQIWRTQ